MKLALAIAVSIALVSLALASSISSQNYTVEQANATINNAYSYVNSVNQSGFLVFQPNLGAPYKYLSNATSIYKSAPGAAILDAEIAQSLARQQYSSMSSYKGASLVVMVLVTALLAIVLAKVMMPVKRRKGR